MGIRFACHECDKQLNIKRELAGKRGVCPECSTRFRIPLQDAPTSSPIKPSHPAQSSTSDATNSDATNLSRDRNGQEASAGAKVAVASADSAATPNSRASVTPSERVSSNPQQPQSDAGTSVAGISSSELLAGDSSATWYVRPPTGGQYGPASADVFRSWIDQGRVAATSLIWRDGWPQWRVASEVLSELIKPPTESDSKSAVAGTSVAVVGSTPDHDRAAAGRDGDIVLGGRSDVGVQRRARSGRRIAMIAVLSAIAITLIVALVLVLNRGTPTQ
tara:strand:- start:77879 stop:78706 length:828 start_codon:yes stop_codon:yes gene_type:complete